MQEIASKENQFIKLAYSLLNKKTREELGLFIIEGKILVSEAFKKKQNFKYIFFLDKNLYVEFEKLINTSVECFLIPENLMGKISSTESPPPILAILEKAPNKSKLDGNFFVYGEDIQDPGNLGSIIRTAFASGVNRIFLSPNSCDLYNPKTLRSSVGTIFYGDVEYKNLDQVIKELEQLSDTKNTKLEILGTSSHAKYDIYKTNFTKDTIYLILIGNEAQGLSQAAIDACTKLIKIPLHNDIESVNVLAATSVVLFEVSRHIWK